MTVRNFFRKHNFLWILIFIIVVISVLTCLTTGQYFLRSPSSHYSFSGDAQTIQYPGLTVTTFKNHEFQKYVEALITKKLRLRNVFIGVNSQLYYSLFKKSFAENSQIIVGKHNHLFEMNYITSYCQIGKMPYDDPEKLIDWADKIKILNDYFIKHGKDFLYVITPSKAEVMPSAIPDRFHCRYVGVRNHIQRIKQLLDERKVSYVDGANLMIDATKTYGIEMFPKGGIHWNSLGATLTANEIIKAINHNNHVLLPTFDYRYTMGKPDHSNSDDDLLSLIKLIKPNLAYTVPKMHFFNQHEKSTPVTLAIIGGSFNENLIKIFQQNNTFSKIYLYFYMSIQKIFSENNTSEDINKIDPLSEKTLNTILSADVIILEENSSLVVSAHGASFYKLISQK